MENTYTVYVHKNIKNNKLYFGITSVPVKQRWKRGSSYSKTTKIRKAIDKYGWDNFEHIILYENLSKEDAEEKEIELINKYKTTNDKYGYNIQNGGFHNGKFTTETRVKISNAKKGTRLSEDTKRKMSISRSGKNHWAYGKTFSKQHKEKLKISHIGQKAWNKGIERSKWLSKENEEKLKQSVRMALIGNKYSCKPIRCVETQIVYEGVFAAHKNTNINMSNISSVCNGKRKTAGGYHWEYVKGGD